LECTACGEAGIATGLTAHVGVTRIIYRNAGSAIVGVATKTNDKRAIGSAGTILICRYKCVV
jgi:hypothetical protein